MFRLWLCALAMLGFLAATAGLAQAHAVLLEGHPAAAGRVGPGGIEVRLRYNSRIDAARSRLTLMRPDGAQTVLSIATGTGADVLVATAELGPGAHVLRWQVLAVDGHITRGEIRFTVLAGSP